MQFQRSGASAPIVAPPQPPRVPEVVPTPVRPSKHQGRWLVAVLLILAAAGLYYLLQWRAQPAAGTGKPGAAAVRTAQVAAGTVDMTVRVTGTTGAEKFVTLVTPLLRGSRSNRGRGGSSGNSSGSSGGGSTTFVVQSNAGTSSSSGNSLSTGETLASTSSAMSSGGGATGTARSASSAFLAATTRTGRSSSSSSRSSSSSSSSSSSAALGSSGMGSTASNLSGGSSGPPSIGGSGGGRSRGDFSLILEKLINPGSHVKKGDVIGEFDRQFMLNRLDDYRDTVRQEEASVTKSKAEIEVARVAHEQSLIEAKGDLEKAQLDIKTTPVLGTIDAERLRLALDEAQARYKQLLEEVKYFEASQKAQLRIDELDLAQAKVELKRSEANVDKMVVRAPIDGLTVMMNTFRSGQFDQIKEGDELHSGQPFVQVVDPSSMVINAVVNQTDVEQLRIGQKAKVRFDAFPGLELPARIYSIGTVAKPGRFRPDFVKEIPVVLRLEKMDPRVIPDLSVGCDVILKSEDRANVVPREAVFTDRGGKPYVFVRQGPEWQRREVNPGLVNYTQVAVQAGLSPGEVVALERPPQVAKKD